MASRSVRRRQHKQLKRILSVEERRRLALASQLLSNWRAEARRRARYLGAPAVWLLPRDTRIRAMIRELDQSGELLGDLCRACAEAIAEFTDRRMVLNRRPLSTYVRRRGGMFSL